MKVQTNDLITPNPLKFFKRGRGGGTFCKKSLPHKKSPEKISSIPQNENGRQSCGCRPKTSVFLLVCSKSRTLDTLYQILLAEEVYYYERSYYHNSASISYSRVIQVLSRIIGSERRGDSYYLRHQNRLGRSEEEVRVEVVRPLPRECEQEYRYHHRYGQRQNDSNKRSDYTRTVYISRFLKLVGNASEELSQHKYVKSVLKRESAERKDYHRPIGVGKGNSAGGKFLPSVGENIYRREEIVRYSLSKQAYSAAVEELEYSENIEISEIHKQRELKRLVRYYEREDNREEYELVTLELELCKSVSNEAAYQRLNYSRTCGKKQRIRKCLKVVKLRPYSLVNVEGKVLRYKSYRYVNEILGCHKGTCNLRKEREKNYVRDTYEQYESEQKPYYLFNEKHREEFSLKSLFKGSSFKLDLYFVFGFFLNLRLVINILCVHC